LLLIESTFDLSEDERKRVKLHAEKLFASWMDTSENDCAAVESALARMFERERLEAPPVVWVESPQELGRISAELGPVDRSDSCAITFNCPDPITKAFTRALSKANLTWPLSWQARVMQIVGADAAVRWREASARARVLLSAHMQMGGVNGDWIAWGKWAGDLLPVYGTPALALASSDWAQDLLAQIADMFTLRTGAFAYVFADATIFVCRNPVLVNVDERNRLHSFDQPALQFADGYSVFAWSGVNVDAHLVLEPDSLSVEHIDAEENIELRRVMIERYGVQRYLEESGAMLISEDECGVLLRKEVPGDEPILMVKVINSTAEPDGTYKEYFLRVPPDVSSAREGVAWTFGLEPHEYAPAVES
jgi:hypothetical protein